VVSHENDWTQSVVANNVEINLTAPSWMTCTNNTSVVKQCNRKLGIVKYILAEIIIGVLFPGILKKSYFMGLLIKMGKREAITS
jgi:hypothetical protein